MTASKPLVLVSAALFVAIATVAVVVGDDDDDPPRVAPRETPAAPRPVAAHASGDTRALHTLRTDLDDLRTEMSDLSDLVLGATPGASPPDDGGASGQDPGAARAAADVADRERIARFADTLVAMA